MAIMAAFSKSNSKSKKQKEVLIETKNQEVRKAPHFTTVNFSNFFFPATFRIFSDSLLSRSPLPVVGTKTTLQQKPTLAGFPIA